MTPAPRRQAPTGRATDRALSVLLVLYPKDFRREYARPVAQLIRDQRRDLGEAAVTARARFWLSVVADIARSAGAEHAAGLRAAWRHKAPHRRRVWLGRIRVMLGLGLLTTSGSNVVYDVASPKLSMGIGAIVLTAVGAAAGAVLLARARRVR